MAVWIWTGNDDKLYNAKSFGQPFAAGVKRADVQGNAADYTGAYSKLAEASREDAIIVCTADHTIDPGRFNGAWVLNASAQAVGAMTSFEKQRRWFRSGVNREGDKLVSIRRFMVSVVHLHIAGIERLGGRHGKEAGMDANDPMLRRVERAAVKALYALGLDIGEVEVALGGDGRIAVLEAWPLLRDAEGLREFEARHDAMRAADSDRRGLLIGADPEFVLVTPSGKIAPASRFFGEGVGGAAGADALRVGRRVLYPVAELRPAPAAEPAALAAGVRRLLMRAAERVSDPSLRWVAGAMPVPGLALGGHIHISGAPLTSRLLRLLDSFAAFPLALVEDPAGRARRPRYGSLGDYRLQQHGGFEYRTLPSWLVSPAAAKAAFALALLCAREAWNLRDMPALDERYVEAYYSGDRATLAGCLDTIAAALSATESYAELARFIEPLLDAARRGKTWDERADIRTKWRIPLGSTPQ